MRHCLIVSPHFPPSTVAGVHRARHLAKHLPAHGWDPTVICVDPRHHVERLDPDLATLVPSSLDIVTTGATPVALTRPFGLVGEIGLRGFFHLRAAIAACIAQRRPDAVLITGSPFYPMLLASWIKRRWGIQVILDFQDPWVSSEGATRTRWTKGWLSYRLAALLEPRAVRGASWITSVSDRQNRDMAKRYPALALERMSAIPIGGDPEDFAALRDADTRPAVNDRIAFSFVGTAMPRSTPLLDALFRGLAHLRDTRPALAERVSMRFVGTSNQPGERSDYRVLPLAQAAGVADLITEEPGRVPYLDALRLLATTSATLMIGSDEPHYTASKIYPCLMSGRPFLSLFHAESSAHAILTRAGGGVPLAFTTPEQLNALVPAIAEALARIITDPASLGRIAPAAFAPFTAHAVAGEFARVFANAGAAS